MQKRGKRSWMLGIRFQMKETSVDCVNRPAGRSRPCRKALTNPGTGSLSARRSASATTSLPRRRGCLCAGDRHFRHTRPDDAALALIRPRTIVTSLDRLPRGLPGQPSSPMASTGHPSMASRQGSQSMHSSSARNPPSAFSPTLFSGSAIVRRESESGGIPPRWSDDGLDGCDCQASLLRSGRDPPLLQPCPSGRADPAVRILPGAASNGIVTLPEESRPLHPCPADRGVLPRPGRNSSGTSTPERAGPVGRAPGHRGPKNPGGPPGQPSSPMASTGHPSMASRQSSSCSSLVGWTFT